MPKWLGQRDQFRCGPIALVNVMKWVGLKKFKRHKINEMFTKKYLTKRLIIPGDTGTYFGTMSVILDEIPGIDYYYVPRLSRRKIERHLKAGGIILISYLTTEDRWHCTLLTEMLGDFYLAINLFRGETISILDRNEIVKEMSLPKSEAYFIRKISCEENK